MDLYLDLLSLALLGLLGRGPLRAAEPGEGGSVEIVTARRQGRRRAGFDWPVDADTMVGVDRLANVRDCVEEVLADGVPGDLIETGVWRGGAAIYMRAVLAAHGVRDRRVWVADSFQGLPAPDVATYPQDEGDTLHEHDFLAVSEEEVRANFERYGLLDDQVRFLPGWFRDTLPSLGDERFAVIRLDGDMYESTMVALEALYPRLSPGGFVIVDDYVLDPCRAAVEDYRDRHRVAEPLRKVDWSAVCWRKGPVTP